MDYFGWHGTGSMDLDPQSGYGAYVFNGGANGGAIVKMSSDTQTSISDTIWQLNEDTRICLAIHSLTYAPTPKDPDIVMSGADDEPTFFDF